MPQESLGYIKLEWVCPKCSSRNPGPEKACLSCGAPQPKDVKFQQAEQQELIKDQKEVDQAKLGPDIHCAFCGTRNPANAITCAQCGADLKEGLRREAGQVVGAFVAGAPVKQVACPSCATLNPATALKCASCGASLAPAAAPVALPRPPAPVKMSPVLIGIIAVVVVLCVCAGIYLLMQSSRTESHAANVDSVQWTTSIAIEAIQEVTYQQWVEEIPENAEIGTCTPKVHHIQDQPAANANKVCGTPYTVDKGSGFAEVVQDCQYEVLMDFCNYTVLEWRQVDTLQLQGNDFQPRYGEPQLTGDQRIGEREQAFVVIFSSGGDQYTYTAADYDQFLQFQVGSEWILNINGFGQVVSVEPAP
jgi:ribosomal protein L40E